ncbi:MAG: PLP-dependent aminotransferase family protein [Chloroflexota bacterium]
MAKQESFISLSGIDLDRASPKPLHRQLYEALRTMTLAGQLPAGSRLPPTRALSQELAISRSTIVNAFDQLMAEGYLEGKVGAGTFVSEALPEEMLTVSRYSVDQHSVGGLEPIEEGYLSKRGRQMVGNPIRDDACLRAFTPGVPETNFFPFGVWRRLLNKHWDAPTPTQLTYGMAAGYLPLRQAIADYVQMARGVRCTAEQVIIVSGSQQGLHLTVQLLTDAGDAAWIEDPGYKGTQAVFLGAGLDVTPVPVDAQGLRVDDGLRHCPHARIVYTCPSHQYPAGVTLSLARRMQLLSWAQQTGAWILEDDYDSEYRFADHPLASLQGLAHSHMPHSHLPHSHLPHSHLPHSHINGHSIQKNSPANQVIYLGTFSKVLFPALRLGYMIVPPALSEAFATARRYIDRGSPIVTQMALTDFINGGHFARHIRRMRTLYACRQQVLIESIAEHCGDWVTTRAAPAGLHLVGWLQDDLDDVSVSETLHDAGIDAPSLSSYRIAKTGNQEGGLVMGYAALDEGVIRASVKKIGTVLRDIRRP